MGFDLYGRTKISDIGKYFRNSCWGWRPLWKYVYDNCSDILTLEDYINGEYNNGHFINKQKSLDIADRLSDLVKTGSVNKYEVQYRIEMASMPDETCWLCSGTGIRSDIRITMTNGCNVCSGSGKRRPDATLYPFREDNVKEFIEFCKSSDGFEIN